MCPDKALLSAWYDGEVESPWNEELEKHVEQCEHCSALVDELENLSLFLQNDDIVLSRYKKREIYRQVMHQHRRKSILPVWQKSVPWPAAAAAAVVLGIALVFPSFSHTGRPVSEQIALSEESDLTAMEELIPIMLPPEQSLSYYGDSQLLKTASFERIAQ